MTPGSSTTVSSPKYLTDLGVWFDEPDQPFPDEALLSASVQRYRVAEFSFRDCEGGSEKPIRPTLRWTEFVALPKSQEEESATTPTIPIDELAPWVRQSLPKLLQLCRLGQNWDSYGGIPPSRKSVHPIVRLLQFTEIEDLPQPEVVPTSEGGFQLEWYMGNHELEIELHRDGAVEFLASDIENGTEREGLVDDLNALRTLLIRMSGRS